MSLRDSLLALCVVIAWGVNFVVIKIGLEGMPPLLLACLRFLLVAFPASFFIKRPQVPLRWLALYGLTISFGQFALLFMAIKLGMPAGIASLILQAQAFFTLLLGALLLKEQIKIHNWAAITLAAIGIALLASPDTHNTIVFIPLLLTLGSALSWGMGNIVNKSIMRHHDISMLSLVIWSAWTPTFAFAISSILFEGTPFISSSLMEIKLHNILALIYLAFVATILGYSGWGFLLSRYDTWRIAPLSLLVPVFGILSAALFLGERLNHHQMVGTMIIGIGLILNIFGNRLIHLIGVHLPKTS